MESPRRTPPMNRNPVHPYYITRRYSGQRNAREVVAHLIQAHGEQQ